MQTLLTVTDFHVSAGDLPLVKGVHFVLEKGKTLGIVGESGSGKSLTSLAIMGLLDKSLNTRGSIVLQGQELVGLDAEAHRKLRVAELGMIFQEPMSALNPSMRVGKQVAEALRIRGSKKGHPLKEEVLELFKKVELPRPEKLFDAYPHQLSGGQMQRVVIAIALAAKPAVLIADEPTTALDVSVQKSILTLLKQLQHELEMGLIFISHDLAVVEGIADDILVMHKGEQVEYGPAAQVFHHPKEAYTKGLLACRPKADTQAVRLPLVQDFLGGAPPQITLRNEEARQRKAEKRMEQTPLFEVKQLHKYFGKQQEVTAVDAVGFQIFAGESLGLVGESGSGKTTIGRILCGLEQASAGHVFYKGEDITRISPAKWRKLHEEIQIIFQDPFSSLNPRIRIGDAIAEVLIARKGKDKREARQEVENLLEKTGLKASDYRKYPHEFSGGQRQRIGIARAIAVQPEFIVCDESVSALDVSVQAQVLNLLNDLKDEFNFTYLFISHDLAVVKYFCERILVLQRGALVESGFADVLYAQPQQAYTRSLIDAMPKA
jgi:peptide/nickel transport system ATP-binding protein